MSNSTVDIRGSTQANLRKVNFTWVINNFMIYCSNNCKFQSPSFADDPNGDIKWKLSLSVNDGRYNDFYFEISLQLDESTSYNHPIPCKYSLTILIPNHEEEQIVWLRNTFSKNSVNNNTITKKFSNLQNPLDNDKLTIVCQFHFITDEVKLSEQIDTIRQIKNNDCKLADNFAKLLSSQMLSDVKLVVGKQEFPAHKIVLAARSEVFAAMFQHEMEESLSGQVLLDDVRPEVLEEMLTFIYTEKSPNMDKMADELLVVADKYALKTLHAMAEVALFRKLTQETAIETLILASCHNGKFLKRQTIKYIHLHAKNVIKTESWKKDLMSHPDLLAELFEAIFTTQSEGLGGSDTLMDIGKN